MKRLWRPATIVLSVIAAPILLVAALYCFEVRINLTPSYPMGLWRIAPLDRPVAVGDLVFICPPENAAFMLARDRGYLRRGLCPGWISPLIKTVAALPGQRIVVGDVVMVDGLPLIGSDVRRSDPENRALYSWSGGVVPAGFLFLHSNFEGSYDSRYFGPVPAAGTLGLAREVFTYGP